MFNRITLIPQSAKIRYILTLLFVLLNHARCYIYENQNITHVKQTHEFSDRASNCPKDIQKQIQYAIFSSQILSMTNLYLDNDDYFTVVQYQDTTLPMQLILWDQKHGNHKVTQLQILSNYISQAYQIQYVKELKYLVITKSSNALAIFMKQTGVFQFDIVIDINTDDISNNASSLITDMFFLDNYYDLVLLDHSNSKFLFYDLRYLTSTPYKTVTIPIPNRFFPYPSAFYARAIPNSNQIAMVDFSKALIKVIDYVTSDIIYTANHHIANIPRNPTILGVYKKDNLVVIYNNQMIYKFNRKQTFQVFSVDKQLELISEFFIDYKNSTNNQLESMMILQDSAHAVTSHTQGDIYIHSLYTGEMIRHFHHSNFTVFDIKFYNNHLVFSTTDAYFNIIAYFYDWNTILYPEIRDSSAIDVCVAKCGNYQGLNSDLLACSPCDPDKFCMTCKFPSGSCDSCQNGYYLQSGNCLSFCKGEEGSFTYIEPNQCQCNKGYYQIDEMTCIANTCKSHERPEYDFRLKETVCHRICSDNLFYDKASDECVCIQGYVKIGSSCSLDITSICLIIFFAVISAILVYKYRHFLIFNKSKVFFQVDDIQQGIQLRKFFQFNKKNSIKDKDNLKNKEFSKEKCKAEL